MKQYIFIDDSGDPGFKFRQGSSRYFVIACVIFENNVDVEYTSASLKVYKHELGWHSRREFKFHKTNYEQRIAFLKYIEQFNFKIRAVVVDKEKLNMPDTKHDNFYRHVIREVLSRYAEMKNANIYLDGGGGKNYRKRSAGYLRQELNKVSHKMSNFKFVDSKTDNLIQIADMVAGSIRRQYDISKTDSEAYFEIIRAKVEDIWEYSK
jgi:hypothetical protein